MFIFLTPRQPTVNKKIDISQGPGQKDPSNPARKYPEGRKVLNSEADRLTRVLVCTPSTEYTRVGHLEDHNIIEGADRAKALAQHRRLRGLLQRFGADVFSAGF